MKRYLTLLLSISLLIISAFALQSCSCGGDYSPIEQGETIPPQYVDNNGVGYDKNSDGSLCVVSVPNADNITIPEKFQEMEVTSIGKSSFKMSTAVTVTLPKTVKTIGEYAFAFSDNLEEVNIPEGVLEIGTNAFSGCTSLKSVKLPETLKEIGIFAFDGSGLESIVIPKNVKNVSDYAFAECENLGKVTFECDKVSIADTAFKTSINVSFVGNKNSTAISFAKLKGIEYTEK
ncbi:MAG: leucine-rich repeat domain-containing protein [Ruminococcus sp.]